MPTGTAARPIHVPSSALVLLIGASGSGKSTFASKHFDADAVVSSDALRGILSGDESDQRKNQLVFDRLHHWVEARLATALLAVVDATNTDWIARAGLIRQAHRYQRPTIAIVFDLPLEICLERSATRPRTVGASVIRRQIAELSRDLDRLDLEGFSAVYVLFSAREIERVVVHVEKGPAARALFS